MDGHKGGSSTPSYKEAVTNKCKKLPKRGRGNAEEGRRNGEEDTNGSISKENDNAKNKEETDKK